MIRRYVYELKMDGFRALAEISAGQVRLISRHGNTYQGFSRLGASIRAELEPMAILDGEICQRRYAPRSQSRFSVTFVLPVRCGGIASIAVDILHERGHGDKSRKVAHEFVDLLPKNLRGPLPYSSGPSRRVVTSGKCDM